MKRRILAFTLVELVATVAVVAILISIGIPAMRDLIQNNRQANTVNSMLVSLNLARGVAVKHGAETRVCISDQEAQPNCDANSSAWENGWIIFVDANQDGLLEDDFDKDDDEIWDAGEDWLLRVSPPLSTGTTFTAALGGGAEENDNFILYNARGFTSTAGTLTLCDGRGEEFARGLIINNTGRARVAVDTDKDDDDIVEGGNGANLACP